MKNSFVEIGNWFDVPDSRDVYQRRGEERLLASSGIVPRYRVS